MENELKEGEYLAAGVKKVPIPYTQDPLLKGDKEDMAKDSTILKGNELRSDEDDANNKKANDKEAKGKHSPEGSINKKGESAGSAIDGTVTESLSYNEFKVGDTVCLNNIKNREWIIEGIKLNEGYAQFNLRSGLRKMIVRPDEMIVEHIHGVDSAQGCGSPTELSPELMPKQEARIMERNELYAHIKNKELHTNGDRGQALQSLGEMCGNPMEEIHSVYEDACASCGNPVIDSSYGYAGDDVNNEANGALMNSLSAAYEEVMQKEMAETAKKSAEEGDRTGSKGGLGPINLG
jgi:hypothetical protein